MKHAQLIPYPLPSVAYAASGNATTTLRDLPKTLFGRIAHLAGISFEVSFPVTSGLTLSSGTVTPFEAQNIVNRLEIFDGSVNRFVGNFASLRMREAYENGGPARGPEFDAIATTEAAAFMRYWGAGPDRFAGSSDFVIPCAALDNAEVRYGFGAITDLDANVTAVVATITPVAWLMLLDEVRIPPLYEVQGYTSGATDINLTGRALYANLALAENAAFGAISALDFANVQVDTGHGQVVPNVHAAILNQAYHALNASGQIVVVTGDARASTVDGPKEINPGTPTALQVQAFRLSPVLWSARDQKITKLVAMADSALRVRWSGANTTGYVLSGRILEQNETAVAAMAARALNKLGRRDAGIKIKTLSKEPYKGPRSDFMPWSVKLA